LAQKNEFKAERVKDSFSKYSVLKINNFDDVAKDTLDEWTYCLKNSEVFRSMVKLFASSE